MDLVEQAAKVIAEESVAEVMKQADNTDYLIVDVRDIRERQRDGFIPQSFHCPRGRQNLFWGFSEKAGKSRRKYLTKNFLT
jgi:hypothetical protein